MGGVQGARRNGLFSSRNGHALVVGGGIAGLLAARVLSEHFDQVTLIERDRFPEGPEPRRGVPQSRHLHVFLMRGRLILEELFPGIEEDLLTAGADLIDVAGDSAFLTPAGWGIRFSSGLPFLMCSRDLLEWGVRERVAALKRVRFLERADATNLLLTTDGTGVAGAKIRFRDGRNSGVEDEEVRADLVVDASGRNSNAPRWLEALGYPPPEETVVDAHLGYATRLYERPTGHTEDWKALYVLQPAPPEITRGGGLFPLEGNRWMCTLSGVGRDTRRPTKRVSWTSPAPCVPRRSTRPSKTPSR